MNMDEILPPVVSGWQTVTADDDRIINEGVTLLHGVYLTASNGTADVDVYEGTDAFSGRRVFSLKAPNGQTKEMIFDPPILLERGIYLVTGNKVYTCLVAFTPVRGWVKGR